MYGINKWAAGALALAVMGPSLAFAQTSAASSSIQALLEQIKSLQTQIVALQQQQRQAFISLVATLKEGSAGDQVTTLQTLLALDPSIYPEGKITGFFGRLTAQAVKRFQKKHGIEQAGNVGPKTLKKLNEVFGHVGSSTKDRDNGKDNDRDSNGAGKVVLCHKPGKENETIRVGTPALKAHIAHGDTLGACAGTATTTPAY